MTVLRFEFTAYTHEIEPRYCHRFDRLTGFLMLFNDVGDRSEKILRAPYLKIGINGQRPRQLHFLDVPERTFCRAETIFVTTWDGKRIALLQVVGQLYLQLFHPWTPSVGAFNWFQTLIRALHLNQVQTDKDVELISWHHKTQSLIKPVISRIMYARSSHWNPLDIPQGGDGPEYNIGCLCVSYLSSTCVILPTRIDANNHSRNHRNACRCTHDIFTTVHAAPAMSHRDGYRHGY